MKRAQPNPVDAVALSIKQPWATLVVHGIKTIELRSWRTERRGWVYIHTGRGVESSPAAWAHVPNNLASFAEQRGGIIGRVRIVGCKEYSTRAAFAADRGKHLVPARWYSGSRLFGFECADAAPLDLIPCKGQLFFWNVARVADQSR